jgi:signal transduction histidine kinase
MSLKPLIRIFNKIHIRQGIAFTLMFAVGTGIAFFWVFMSLYRSLVNDARETVTSTLLAYWAEYREEGRINLIRSIRTDQDSDFLILLTDSANQALASHIPGTLYRELLPQLRDYPYPEPGIFSIRNPDGKKMVFYTGALHISDDMTLRVIINMDRSFATFRNMQQRFFEVILVLLITSFIAGTLSTVGALQPINHLNRDLLALSETTDIGKRLPTRETGDQLDNLTQQINHFLARIESLVAGMRQAVDNTAHDLRTPLTRMKARAETALLRNNPGIEELRDALIGCLEESDIIIRMVNSLMDIAEAEQGVLRLNKSEMALPAALGEIHELYTFVSEEKGILLRLMMDEELPAVPADPVRFRQIIGNLLDNAVKFAPAGSTVILTARLRDNQIHIGVTDEGPGIDPVDLPRIWDRLYRAETSRTTKGLGLGLSLVKALTEAHGWSVAAGNRSGGGTEFTVSLPMPDKINITKL